MGKKNPYVFTIGFNKKNPLHVQAARLLNESSSKAQLIASALVHASDSQAPDPQMLCVNVKELRELLADAVEEALGQFFEKSSSSTTIKEAVGEIEDLSENGPVIPKDTKMAENIIASIDAFRAF